MNIEKITTGSTKEEQQIALICMWLEEMKDTEEGRNTIDTIYELTEVFHKRQTKNKISYEC